MIAQYSRQTKEDDGNVFYTTIATAELSKSLIERYSTETDREGNVIKSENLMILIKGEAYTPEQAIDLIEKAHENSR